MECQIDLKKKGRDLDARGFDVMVSWKVQH